jgi:hypothetical protein
VIGAGYQAPGVGQRRQPIGERRLVGPFVAQGVLDRRRHDLGDALEDAALVLGVGAALVVVRGERAVGAVVDAQRADQHLDDGRRPRRQAVAAPGRNARRERRDQRAAVLEDPRDRPLHELARDRRGRIGRVAPAHPAAGRPRRFGVVQEEGTGRERHQPAEPLAQLLHRVGHRQRCAERLRQVVEAVDLALRVGDVGDRVG